MVTREMYVFISTDDLPSCRLNGGTLQTGDTGSTHRCPCSYSKSAET